MERKQRRAIRWEVLTQGLPITLVKELETRRIPSKRKLQSAMMLATSKLVPEPKGVGQWSQELGTSVV